MKGLLVDFGGVLTTNVFASFRAFCTDEGIDPDRIKALFRSNAAALAAVRALEKGELSEDEFDAELPVERVGMVGPGLYSRITPRVSWSWNLAGEPAGEQWYPAERTVHNP